MSKKESKFKFILDYRNGKDLKCPECGAEMECIGERETTQDIYCTKCKFAIIVD